LDDDTGLATALSFADDYTATTALVNALQSDPAVESRLFGDIMFFDRADGDATLVYDADENRFWTDDEYAASPFSRIVDADVQKATVFRQTADDPLDPATYTVDRFEDETGLFSRAYQQEYDGLIVMHPDGADPVVYDRLEDRFWTQEEYEDSLYHTVDTVRNDERFREMLDDVYDAVRDTANYCNMDNDRITGVPTTMAFAAYGEGFVLGKVSGAGDDYEEYMMAHIAEDRAVAHGASPAEITPVRFSRSTLPSGNVRSQTKQRFARDYVVGIHADNPATPGVFYMAYNPNQATKLADEPPALTPPDQ
jgi:hypothetical protein